MHEGLIRVREFARNCGCTPQNIYGHLKTYAEELEGHTFQGKGRQGLLLDDFAQDFLRSVMYPKEVADNTLMDEINQLRAELLNAGMESTRLAAKLAATEGERDRAMLEVSQYQKALKNSEAEERARREEVEKLTDEIKVANGKVLETESALKTAKERLEKREEENARLQEQNDAMKAYLALSRWKRIFTKPPALSDNSDTQGV